MQLWITDLGQHTSSECDRGQLQELKRIMLEKFDDISKLIQENSTHRQPQQLIEEEEDSDDKVIKLMGSTKEQTRRKTTPAEAFRVMKCPVTHLTNLTGFEKELKGSIRLRNCLRYAISASVTGSSNTDKNNMACVRDILKKVATNKVWTFVSVSGRSGTKKISMEHEFPNIFNVVSYLIEEKTSVKEDKVKEFISRVFRALLDIRFYLFRMEQWVSIDDYSLCLLSCKLVLLNLSR